MCKEKKIHVEAKDTKNLSVAQQKTRICYIRNHHKVMDLAFQSIWADLRTAVWKVKLCEESVHLPGWVSYWPDVQNWKEHFSSQQKIPVSWAKLLLLWQPCVLTNAWGGWHGRLCCEFSTLELQVPEGSYGCSATCEQSEVCASCFVPCFIPHHCFKEQLQG